MRTLSIAYRSFDDAAANGGKKARRTHSAGPSLFVTFRTLENPQPLFPHDRVPGRPGDSTIASIGERALNLQCVMQSSF